MANTKKALYVANSTVLTAVKDLLGNSNFDPDYAGISYAGDQTGDAIVMPAFEEDLYVGATKQEHEIVTGTVAAAAFADGETLFVTLIDITDGRQVFPRKTFSGTTVQELIDAINGASIMDGDGRTLTCQANNATENSVTGFKILSAEDQMIKVAVNEEVTTTVTETAGAFHKGYTQEEAIEFAKNMATQIYGRTNRVGFPIVEPDFGAELTSASYSLVTITKTTTRFDKNFGAGYIDEEKIYILHNQTTMGGWTLA